MDSTLFQNEYVLFTIIMVCSVIGAKIVLFFIEKYIKKLTKKTKTDLDDLILKIISTPLYVILLLSGTYYAVNTLTVLQPYLLWIDRLFYVVITFVAASVVTKVLSLLVSRWFNVDKELEKTPKLVNKIIGIIVFLVAGLMILNYFRIKIGRAHV